MEAKQRECFIKKETIITVIGYWELEQDGWEITVEVGEQIMKTWIINLIKNGPCPGKFHSISTNQYYQHKSIDVWYEL